jgi:hypothetical protein
MSACAAVPDLAPRPEGLSPDRRYERLTRLLYGIAYTDMCAFRAIRREALEKLGMREMTYGWNLEMQMRAGRAGLRILEVPVAHRRRIGGTSKVSGTVIGTLAALRRRGYRVRRLKDGFPEWKAAGLPVEGGHESI